MWEPIVLAAALNADLPDEARLRAMAARFAPVELRVDTSALPPGERAALARLIEASRLLDAVFLRQVWAGNESLLLTLLRDESPLGRARLRYFLINKGPWSRLDGNAPFIPDVPAKPEGANYYPAGATKAEVQAWLDGLSETERAQARGFFTTLRRGGDGRLVSVPYALEYQGELAQAAERLREAARLTAQPSLKAFLEKRAEAFVTNDYYASDVAWMELESTIEPTIGPYETYEDGWFGAKAGFEAFITLRDEAETAKLARFSKELQWLEDRLPVDPSLRSKKIGALAPIRVVRVVFSAGDGNRGVQTAAYNLPNDERVVAEKGAKRVMLKNTQEAKYEKVLVPISRVALSAADREAISFDAFFTHILMHEVMHGLGPQRIVVGGSQSSVRQELKDLYGTIEEAKADVSGLWALQQLIDKGVVDRALERTLYTTYLASAFRSVRFGLTEAHGRGVALQLDFLLEQGAFRVAADGTFAVDPARIKQGVTALARELLTIEGEGSYAKASAFLARRVVLRPEVQRVLERLGDVPVDIEPHFVTAEELSARYD